MRRRLLLLLALLPASLGAAMAPPAMPDRTTLAAEASELTH